MRHLCYRMEAMKSTSTHIMSDWQQTSQWMYRIDWNPSTLTQTLPSAKTDKIHRILLLSTQSRQPIQKLNQRKQSFRTKLSFRWVTKWWELRVPSPISTWKGRPYCRRDPQEMSLTLSTTTRPFKITEIIETARADTQLRVVTLAHGHPLMEVLANTCTKVPITRRIRSVEYIISLVWRSRIKHLFRLASIRQIDSCPPPTPTRSSSTRPSLLSKLMLNPDKPWTRTCSISILIQGSRVSWTKMLTH